MSNDHRYHHDYDALQLILWIPMFRLLPEPVLHTAETAWLNIIKKMNSQLATISGSRRQRPSAQNMRARIRSIIRRDCYWRERVINSRRDLASVNLRMLLIWRFHVVQQFIFLPNIDSNALNRSGNMLHFANAYRVAIRVDDSRDEPRSIV